MRLALSLALIAGAVICLFLVWYAESLVIASVAFVAVLLASVIAHKMDPPNRRG
jgi:hypothetical protein